MHPPSRRAGVGFPGPPVVAGTIWRRSKPAAGGTETALEGPGGVIAPESVLRGSRAGLAVAGFVGAFRGRVCPLCPAIAQISGV